MKQSKASMIHLLENMEQSTFFTKEINFTTGINIQRPAKHPEPVLPSLDKNNKYTTPFTFSKIDSINAKNNIYKRKI